MTRNSSNEKTVLCQTLYTKHSHDNTNCISSSSSSSIL